VEARGVRHALGELPERERRRAAHVARRVSQRGDHRGHDPRHGALETLRAPFRDDPEHGDARVPSPRAVGHRRGGVRQRVRRERQYLGKHVLCRRVERQKVHQARRNRLYVLLVLVVDFRGVAGKLALLGLAAQRAERTQQRRHHLGATQRLGLVSGQERYRVQRAAARDGVQVARAGDFHAKRHDVFDSARQGPRLRLRQLVQHLERQRRVPLLAGRDRVARDREHGEHQPAQNVRLVLRAPRGRVRGERQRGAQRRGAHARRRIPEAALKQGAERGVVAGHGADDGLRQRREEHERHLAVALLRALRALREELGERVPRAHRDGRLGHLAHDVRDGAAHRGDGLAHDALEQRVLELLLARRRKRRPVRQDFALEDHRGELPHARVGVPARVAKERGDATPARIPDERLERRLRDASGLVLRGQQRAEDLGEVLQRRARRRSRRGGHLELSSRRHETLNSGRASDTPTRFSVRARSAAAERRRVGSRRESRRERKTKSVTE